MEAGLPDVDTEYNVEGRAAHSLAAEVLAHFAYETKTLAPYLGPDALTILNGTTEVPVHLKSGGTVLVPVTPEMRNAIFEYADLVMTTFGAIEGPKKLYIEHRVSLANLSPPEEMFGTADAIIVSGRTHPVNGVTEPQQLVVIDLKYGTGVVVEVRDNPQLMEYALASMLSVPHEGDGMWADARFRTIIVQPRAPHPDGSVREWEYSYDEIREFGHKLLKGAHAAHAPDAPLTPGSWCRWCKAAAFCPALMKETQDVAQREFDTYVTPDNATITIPTARFDLTHPDDKYTLEIVEAKYDVVTPDPDRISLGQAIAVLDKAEMVEGFIAAIRERIRAEIAAGREVPGWKLVAGRPQREWVSEADVEEWYRDHVGGAGELYEMTMRSPAQIEKIVGKKNLPADLYRKVSKSEKLVRADDPRPALPSSAQKEFAALPPATDSHPQSVAEPETSIES